MRFDAEMASGGSLGLGGDLLEDENGLFHSDSVVAVYVDAPEYACRANGGRHSRGDLQSQESIINLNPIVAGYVSRCVETV